MNSNRNFALRAVGLVVASFLTVAISMAPASAANGNTHLGGSVSPMDTGWDRK